jgi:hypothetical protein
MSGHCVVVVGFPPLSAETFRGRTPQGARWLLSASLEGFAFVVAARSAETLRRALDPRGECVAGIVALEGCPVEALSLSPQPDVALYAISDFLRACLVGRGGRGGRKGRQGRKGRSKSRLLSEAVYAGAPVARSAGGLQPRAKGPLSGWRIARRSRSARPGGRRCR